MQRTYQEKKFEKANIELTNTNLFANRLMAMICPGMTFIMSGLSVSIYWIGAYLINEAAMTNRIQYFLIWLCSLLMPCKWLWPL